MIALALAATLAQAPSPPPAPVAGTQAPAATSGAQDIWDKHCVFCHGPDGQSRTKKGKQFKAPNFTKARWQKHTTDDEIVEAITNGVPKSKMVSFKVKLSAEEIKSMVPFLRAFAKK